VGSEKVRLDYGFTMKDLPLAERPRERLQKYGAEVLSTPELLAILLRTGTSKMNVLELAHQLLSAFGGLRNLIKADMEDLKKIKGMGNCKAAEVKAAIELGKRIGSLDREERAVIRMPKDAAELIMQDMRYLDREHFRAILLNVKNQILDVVTISIGTVNSSLVHPRELFKDAIRTSSSGVILVHNHPSGDPSPSRQDKDLTTRLIEAGKVLGIEILDHIIIGDNRYVSFKETGLM
jgi:DNA repair protein RadC